MCDAQVYCLSDTCRDCLVPLLPPSGVLLRSRRAGAKALPAESVELRSLFLRGNPTHVMLSEPAFEEVPCSFSFGTLARWEELRRGIDERGVGRFGAICFVLHPVWLLGITDLVLTLAVLAPLGCGIVPIQPLMCPYILRCASRARVRCLSPRQLPG